MVQSSSLVRRTHAEPGAAELVHSVHDLMKAFLRQSPPTLAAEGISMGQFWALHLVSSLEAPTVSTVARHLSISAPAVCSNLDLLEDAGMILRRRSAQDRREVEISLTPKGRRAEARVWAEIGRLMEEVTAGIDPKDIATSTRVFHELRRNLDRRLPQLEAAQ